MKTCKQWINWKQIPKQGKVKPDKVPYSIVKDSPINPHDPFNWMTYEEAKVHSDLVGFVLTSDDHYFCIDLDNALVEDGRGSVWAAPHVQRLENQFPGVYKEISYSKKGLHFFGKSTNIPRHRNKTKIDGYDVELYTQGRYIAFSETSAVGDYNKDSTVELAKFIGDHLFFDKESTVDHEEFSTSDPGWFGPPCDDELIERIQKSKQGILSKLNGKASFDDLYQKDISALSKSYPDNHGTRDYDESSADAAMMGHLAFWTGKDAPRMERIARGSKLVRSKWDTNKGYLLRTINNACKRQKNVYQDPKLKEKEKVASSTDSNYSTDNDILTISDQVDYFKDCIYIYDRHMIFTPQGIMDRDRFDVLYGGKDFFCDHDMKPRFKSAFEAFTKSKGYNFPKVLGTCFRPELNTGEILLDGSKSYVNTYIPSIVKLGTGNVEKFLFLIIVLFPKDRDRAIIMNYMASLVQNPGVKFRWCPVIQGVQGNGKSLLMSCVAYAMGEHYVHVAQANDLGNKFNSWIECKLFIIVEEVNTIEKRETIDALKIIVTNERIPSQAKGKDTITIDNRANFMMATNYKNALAVGKNDRRYAVFYTPQQKKEHLQRDGLTMAFFKEFTDWLKNGGYADVAGYLMRFPIDDSLDPATTMLSAPETSSTSEVLTMSVGKVEQEIRAAIDDGVYGFCNGWISSWALTKLLKDEGINKYLPRNKRAAMLKTIGYVPIPWAVNGRSSSRIKIEDNTQPILYVKENLQYDKILTTDDYIKAQKNSEVIEVPNAPVPSQQGPGVSVPSDKEEKQ